MPCVCGDDLGFHSSPIGACVKCGCDGYQLLGYSTIRLVADQPEGEAMGENEGRGEAQASGSEERPAGTRIGLRIRPRNGEEGTVTCTVRVPPSLIGELARLGLGDVNVGLQKMYAEWKGIGRERFSR